MSGRIKVILTSFVGVAITLFGLNTMASSSAADNRSFQAHFDNVVGLTNHSQVMYHGVRVGEVVKIEPMDNGRLARLTVAIDEKANVEMHSDANLVLRLKTVLGELFLDLEPGKSKAPFKGPLTRTHRDTSLDQMLFQGAALYKDLKAAEQTKVVVDQFKDVIENSGGDIVAIAQNTRTVVDGLTARVDQVNRIIENLDKLTEATDGRASQLGSAVDEVNANIVKLRDLLRRNNDRIKKLLTTVNDIIVSTDLTLLDEHLAKAPEYIDKLDSGLLVLRAFLQHRIPLFSNLIPYPADMAEKFYEEVANLPPWLKSILISVLERYLTEDYCC